MKKTILILLALLLAPAVAFADPVTDATTTTDGAWQLLERYGWIGGALLAYGTLATLLRVNETRHWIAQGRTLAVLTGVVSVAGAAAAWRFAGAPLEAVLTALIGSIALIVKPTVLPVVPAPVPFPAPEAGRA